MIVKEIWSDEDFFEMGWHDARLYRMSFPDDQCRIKFDIDYIFEWVEAKGDQFNFWVAPCLLEFREVYDLKINLDFKNSYPIDILEITRSGPKLSPGSSAVFWDFVIVLHSGEVRFRSYGFEQKVLRQPIFSESQDLDRDK